VGLGLGLEGALGPGLGLEFERAELLSGDVEATGRGGVGEALAFDRNRWFLGVLTVLGRTYPSSLTRGCGALSQFLKVCPVIENGLRRNAKVAKQMGITGEGMVVSD
jgi:hypothetical protein